MSEDTASLISDCSTFLIFGIMMGCLLIVASVMMCLLAYRLNNMAATYKVAGQLFGSEALEVLKFRVDLKSKTVQSWIRENCKSNP